MLVSPKFQSLCQPKLKDSWVFFIDSTSNISRRNPFLLLFFPNCTTVVVVLFFLSGIPRTFHSLKTSSIKSEKKYWLITSHIYSSVYITVNKMIVNQNQHQYTNKSNISVTFSYWPTVFSVLAAMADFATLQTKLETLGWLAAGLEQDGVAVGVAGELLHGNLLNGWTAAGARVAAGGAEGVKAWWASLQETQEQHGAVAPQARQQQVKARVCKEHTQNQTQNRFSNVHHVRSNMLCSKSLPHPITNWD